MQIIIRHHLEGLDEVRLPGGVGAGAQLCHEVGEELRPHVLAVDGEAAVPGEVVEAQRLELGALRPPRRCPVMACQRSRKSILAVMGTLQTPTAGTSGA